MHALNPHLLRHEEASSDALNNLCTVIHQIRKEGAYAGHVIQHKQLLGTFELRCDPSSPLTQATVNLSQFDPLLAVSKETGAAPASYVIGRDGYVVFHATGHHDKLYVTLTRIGDDRSAPAFDSRKLGPGDIVALRPIVPGTYTLTNGATRQKAGWRVRRAENDRYPALGKLMPHTVTLNEKGFDNAKIETWPVQAVVIRLEAPAVIRLKAEKTDFKQLTGRSPASRD